MWKYSIIAALGLAACAPSMPDSGYVDAGPADIGQGVGFGDSYSSYEQSRIERERELRGGTPTIGAPIVADAGTEPTISSGELAAAGLPTADASLPATGDVTGAPATPGSIRTSAPLTAADVTNPGISDEQDFEAVSSRESIESDAQRLERQAQAYTVVPPTAVPTRTGEASPNIVRFALDTNNAVGEAMYVRSGFNAQNKFVRACAKFASPDLAQQAFLAGGGPERDRLGVDPDGDGFACAWNPAPFRAARG